MAPLFIMPHCPRCGDEVRREANFCPQCGEELGTSDDVSQTAQSDAPGPKKIWYWLVISATGGWVLALFGVEVLPEAIIGFIILASWIGMPIGIYFDSRLVKETANWPKHRWAYILGSLILIIAIIPGILYAWKRRSISKRSTSQSSVDHLDTETADKDSTGFSFEVTVENSGGKISLGEDLTSDQKFNQSADSWVPPGTGVNVHGFEISDGMVYVGSELTGLDDFHGTDPALIHPDLDIDEGNHDPDGRRMSYYPSYSEIDPGCRATYLEWLANGRRNPDIAVGYVFLFFYGIERRILFDAKHSEDARTEIPVLLQEIEELLKVYGEESSFPGYASRLLQVARAKYDPQSLETSSEREHPRVLPIGLQLRLGKQLKEGKLVTAEMAYEWFTAHPNTYLRTPARRCPDEFEILFQSKYIDWYGDGWELESPDEQLTITYRPASRSIPQQKEIEVGGVPDISKLELPVEKFQELANACCDELDSYSRYIGRTEDRSSLEAKSLLPQEILAKKRDEKVESLITNVTEVLRESDLEIIELDIVLQHFYSDSKTEVSKKELRRVAKLLEKLGFGLEPDPRFSTPARGWGDPGVIFKLKDGAGFEMSEVTPSIRLIQRLAVKVALANDDFASEQTKYLSDNLGEFLELSEGDHQRLQAHRRWLILDTPTLHGVRQRAEDLSNEQSDRVGKFLTTLAASDGQIEDSEIDELRKIYPMLGLDKDLVGVHIDELRTSSADPKDEPVTVWEPDTKPEEYQIPEPPESGEKPQTSVELDSNRIAERLQESKEVNSFLSEIFKESAEDQSPKMGESKQDQDRVDSSLDEDYHKFLRTLLQQEEWNREELESVSREHGLFPDAAIEVINEHAYEQFESPIFEGTDVIRVDREIGRDLIP